jgi:hypothetical protein
MIAEYERYHGVVLRELIVKAAGPVLLEAHDRHGRVNSFLFNRRVALHLKHSSKRLPPWRFTFDADVLAEIEELISDHPSFGLVLVCGSDGVVALSADDFRQVTSAPANTARFICVDRDRNTLYRVHGNAGKLSRAKARGLAAVVALAGVVPAPVP